MTNKEYYIKLQAKIDDSQRQVESLNKQITTLQNKVKTLEVKVKMPDLSKSGFGKLSPQLKQLGINMSDFKGNILSVNSAFDTTTTRYTNNAGKILTVTEKIVDGQKQYKATLKEVNNAVESNAKQADKWNYSWSKAFQSFVTYMTVTKVFYGIVNTIKDMIGVVTELDSSLVELKKVTDLEGEALEDFTSQAYKAGEEVAKTGKEMIEAATSFAKAGYSEDQILGLGKVAAMYTNIADEAIESADAADFIIAQLKAFNLEAEDTNTTLENAYHIIDAVNEVSNNFAVSSSDIATNLGKASSVMANAGNTLEEMIGLMTAGTEITRNASKVANGLKTITLRLQGMSDEGEEDLELMSKMEDLFNKLGKTVYETDGSLKNTYELLGELADVYPELTAAEKAYVTETIAGKYQAQNAAAILSNWKTAINATTTALNSQGSAVAENAKYIDSIQGKLANLNSAFEKLAQRLIDDRLVATILDLGTALLSIAGSGFGSTAIKATALLVALSALSNKFTLLKTNAQALKLGLIDYYKLQVLLYAQSKNQTIANYEQAASYLGLAGSIKAVTLAIASNPIFLAGTAVVAISSFAAVLDNAKQKTLEMAEASREAATELKTLNDNLSSISDDFVDKLKKYKQVLDDTTSTSIELETANNGLKEIQEKINDLFGEGKVDVYNDSIDETIDKIETLTEKELQLYRVKNESRLQDAREKVREDVNVTIGHGSSDVEKRGFRDFFGDFLQSGDYGSVYFGRGGISTYIHGEAEDAMNFLNDALNYVKENRAKLKEQYGYTDEDLDDLQKQLSKRYNSIDKDYTSHLDFVNEYYDTLLKYTEGGTDYEKAMAEAASDGKLTDKEIEEILDKYPKVASLIKDVGLDYDNLRKKFISSEEETEDLADNISNAYDKVSKARQEALSANTADVLFAGEDRKNDSYITELYDKLKELADSGKLTSAMIKEIAESTDGWTVSNGDLVYSLDGTSVSIADLITYFSILNDNTRKTDEQLKSINTTLDNIQSAYDMATNAVKEYNEQGYLSIDTLQELANMDGKYLECLFNESNQLQVNEVGFRNLAIAQLENLKIKQQEQLLKYVDSLKGEGNQLDENVEKTNNLTNALNEQNTELAKNIALSSVSGDFTEEEQEAIERRVESVAKFFKQINNTINKISGGVAKITTSSKSSSSKTKEWWETELDNLKNQFKYNEITIEEYIRGLDNLLSKVGKGTDAWRQINEELQKQRLSKVDDDYKRGTISLEEYIAKLKELIKAYRQGTEAWNELADKIKGALKDLADKQKDALETAKDAATGIIEDEIDRLKALQKAEEDRYDKLIEEKKKANEETEKELELAKLQEALENAKKEKTKRVWHEGIGWVWEADQEAVKKAQEDLDKFNREDEIDKLEKQKEAASKTYEDKIDALEKYKDAWDDVASEYEKQQARIVLAQQLGADAEKNLLGDRITYLEEYEKKYKQIMAEIAKYETTPSTKLAGADTPAGGTTDGTGGTAGGVGGADTSSSASGASSLGKGSYVSVKPGTKWYSNSYGGGKSGNARSGTIKYINSGGSHPYNIDGLGWVKKTDIVGYRHGGTVDYTGLAMLHGTKSKPEFVLNNDQMKNMLAHFTRPQTTSNISGGNSAVTNYNFGNIELPNVSNAQQFVTELKSLINIQKHQ